MVAGRGHFHSYSFKDGAPFVLFDQEINLPNLPKKMVANGSSPLGVIRRYLDTNQLLWRDVTEILVSADHAGRLLESGELAVAHFLQARESAQTRLTINGEKWRAKTIQLKSVGLPECYREANNPVWVPILICDPQECPLIAIKMFGQWHQL